jgi:hypothetical protein
LANVLISSNKYFTPSGNVIKLSSNRLILNKKQRI